MKLTGFFKCLCAASAVALTPQVAMADLLLEEYFEYNSGDLAGQGKWVKVGTQAGSQCLDVVDSPLTYPGYLDAAKGKAAKITYSTGSDCNQDRDCAIPFVEQANTFTSGKLYASFIINVSDPTSDDVYSLGFSQGIRDTGVISGKAVTEFAKLFIKKGTDANTCQLGIAMNTSTPVTTQDNVPLNTNILVVIAFEFNPATSGGDTAYMWVNPATNLAEEPAEGKLTAAASTARVSRSLGIQGFSLRQGTTPTKHGSTLLFDALRIGTAWSDLFVSQGGSEKPIETAISVKPSAIDLTPNGSAVLQGMTATGKFTVRGTALGGDITLACSNSAVVVSPTTISAADAMSDAGAEVTVSYTATTADALNATITLSSEGATDVSVPVSASVLPVASKASFAFLNNQSEPYSVYCYTGSMAKVSYVDNATKTIYVQDMTGAIRINASGFETLPFAEGDKVKNMYLMRLEDKATYEPVTLEIGTVTSQGNTVTPAEVDFSVIKTDPDSYLYKLCKVSDVTLSPATNETWGSTTVAAADQLGSGRVGVFAGTDLAGQNVPTSALSVTGISTSAGSPVIKMRRAADLEVVAAPAAELSIETIASDVDLSQWLAIGQSYNIGTLRVTYNGLTRDADVYVGGAARNMFSLSTATIPAGAGTVDIAVTYTPTAVGKHTANVTIDATPTELSTSRSIAVKAYDPAKLPQLSVDSSALVPFTATVGEQQQQTISYTVADGLDYGTVKVEPAGAFILGSSSMLKAGTYNLTITFKPQTAGTHNAVVTFSTPMAEDVTVALTGTATGSAPVEEKQGDELTFGGTAVSTVTTDFTTTAATNSVLSLPEWKNVATAGTRAWWSYTDVESDNKMAKATLYDSKANEGSFGQMVLLSPRLSYNTERRLLCFNIMGKFLGDNLDARLDVAYVDAKYADENPANPAFATIEGLNIPATAEENGNWARYILDTENWQLDDEFYIAFILTGTRGRENAASYFVDDFSWGRTDVPFIRIDRQLVEADAMKNAEHTSPEITVTGFNLNSPIEVSVSGTHGKCFTPSVTELPAEGGKVSLKFLTQESGVHNGVLTLNSGDSQSHILLNYNVSDVETGLDSADIASGLVKVFDLMSRNLLNDVTPAAAQAFMNCRPGTVFIVIDANGNATKYVGK